MGNLIDEIIELIYLSGCLCLKLINYGAACELFATEVTLQYQNRSKLKDTIEERHGLRGTALNAPVSDLVEMDETHYVVADIFVTPVNETNVPVPSIDLKTLKEDFRKIGVNFITAGVVGVFINRYVGIDFSKMFWASLSITALGMLSLNFGITSEEQIMTTFLSFLPIIIVAIGLGAVLMTL